MTANIEQRVDFKLDSANDELYRHLEGMSWKELRKEYADARDAFISCAPIRKQEYIETALYYMHVFTAYERVKAMKLANPYDKDYPSYMSSLLEEIDYTLDRFQAVITGWKVERERKAPKSL